MFKAIQEQVYSLYKEKRKPLLLAAMKRSTCPRFRGIVVKAKDFLQNLIREKDIPPKPTLDIDMAETDNRR